MNRPFAIYPDSFDGDTLAHWRFGENAGRLTDVVNGVPFTNFGSVAEQDGRRFDHTVPTHLDTAAAARGEISELTLECWVRDYASPLTGYAVFVQYLISWANWLWIFARRHSTPASSYIEAWQCVGGVGKGSARWMGVDVYDLLGGSEPFHVAAVLDAPTDLRLFVNGRLRATDDTDIPVLPAGNYLTRLGANHDLNYPFSGVLDEPRVSLTKRYTVTFPITRYDEGRRALVRGPGDGAWLGGMVA